MIFDLESKKGLVVMTNEPNGNDFLSDTPAYVFGELPAAKYSPDTFCMTRLNG